METTKPLLIVEDSADMQVLLATLLKREGFRSMKALNGKEALDVLRSGTEKPGLILLDLMMPVMDGYVFRAEQQKDPALSGIPVVIMTAHGQADAKISELRAEDLLRKPIDIDRLLGIVKKYCAVA